MENENLSSNLHDRGWLNPRLKYFEEGRYKKVFFINNALNRFYLWLFGFGYFGGRKTLIGSLIGINLLLPGSLIGINLLLPGSLIGINLLLPGSLIGINLLLPLHQLGAMTAPQPTNQGIIFPLHHPMPWSEM